MPPAVVCDCCIKEKKKTLYAMAGEDGGEEVVYRRVPVDELEEPPIYWPDLHPDKKPIIGG